MSSTLTPVTSIISRATDGELFHLVAAGGDAREEACDEIYRRYFGDLRRDISNHYKFIPQFMVEDLAQGALIRAIEKADDFEEGDVSDAKSARSHTLCFLREIALHKYLNEQREYRGILVESLIHEVGEGSFQLSTKGRVLGPGELYRELKVAEDELYSSSNDDQTSLLKRLVCAALDSLPDRERYILMVTFEYHEYGQEHSRLPNKVVTEISETYNISHDYVRQLRKRALEKIEKYVDIHLRTENETS
jgi:RNA polymerase sigma factor (sigma-70 family)